MAPGRVKDWNRIKKGINILSQVFMLAQIILVIIVLLCSLYLFLGLMNNHSLDFCVPLILWAKGFIHTLFGSSVKSSQPEIDGEVVLFIFVNIFLVFFVSQAKLTCKRCCELIDKRIVEARIREESMLNTQLRKDLEHDMRKLNNFLFIIRLRAKPLVRDTVRSSAVPKEEIVKANEEVMSKFFAEIKNVPGLSFSKNGDVLLVSSGNFDNIDNTTVKVFEILEQLKNEYRPRKIILRNRMAVDAFKSTNYLESIFNNISPLLDLNANNEILCYGNFQERYKLVPNPKLYTYVKGKYDIKSEGETIWALVKKG